jgi:hypothetical protein
MLSNGFFIRNDPYWVNYGTLYPITIEGSWECLNPTHINDTTYKDSCDFLLDFPSEKNFDPTTSTPSWAQI